MTTRRSKQFGPHSLTGKKPVLLANYRRQKHQGPGLPAMEQTSSSSIRDGAIRLVDPMRARELMINEQESKEPQKKLSLQDVSVPNITHQSAGIKSGTGGMNSTTHSNRQEYSGAKKLQILKKGRDYLTEKGIFSEQKPSKTQSLQSKTSRNVY